MAYDDFSRFGVLGCKPKGIRVCGLAEVGKMFPPKKGCCTSYDMVLGG